MLNIVIAEAELELVPTEIKKHPVIVFSAKKQGLKPEELILESTHHHSAMWGLKDGRKRGRPDIIHFCLNYALYTPLNMENMLGLAVHTRNDEIFEIVRYTRIPKNYQRFIGLMRQLLINKKVPPQNPLITMKKQTLEDYLKEKKPTRVFLLSRHGDMHTPFALGKKLVAEKKPYVIIGGFPHGSFSKKYHSIYDEIVSIYEKSLPAWNVIGEVIAGYEQAANIFIGDKNENKETKMDKGNSQRAD